LGFFPAHNHHFSISGIFKTGSFFFCVLCFLGHLSLDLFCSPNLYDWIGCAWQFLVMPHKEQILWMQKEIPGTVGFTQGPECSKKL